MGDEHSSGHEREVTLRVNGEPMTVVVSTSWVLTDVLRDQLGLTGTKVGCGAGVCGACSVVVDGALVSGCLFPAVHLDGSNVQTIEGMGDDDDSITPLQEAFIVEGGFQCGICTPGQIVAASALLAEEPDPTREEIREWMKGNLCRCTGYYGIMAAIERAAGGASQ